MSRQAERALTGKIDRQTLVQGWGQTGLLLVLRIEEEPEEDLGLEELFLEYAAEAVRITNYQKEELEGGWTLILSAIGKFIAGYSGGKFLDWVFQTREPKELGEPADQVESDGVLRPQESGLVPFPQAVDEPATKAVTEFLVGGDRVFEAIRDRLPSPVGVRFSIVIGEAGRYAGVKYQIMETGEKDVQLFRFDDEEILFKYLKDL